MTDQVRDVGGVPVDTPAPDTATVETAAKEIRTRLDNIDEKVSEATSDAAIDARVRDYFEGMEPEEREEFVRKFVHDVPTDEPTGKFAGMSPEDIEFLGALRGSLVGQKRVEGAGMYGDASQELAQAHARAHTESNQRLRTSEEGADTAHAWAADRKSRAMDTAESGYGSQLISDQFVGSLWEASRRSANVWPLIRTVPMTVGGTMYVPVEVDTPELLLVSESTASNSSNYTTTKTGSQRISVTDSKFVMHQMWSGEVEEDSIIPFIPFLRRQAVKGLSFYQDQLVALGDTTNAGTGNINLDDADPADTKAYLAWDGMWHVPIVDNTGNGVDAAGALTYEDFYVNILANMVDTSNAGGNHDWGLPNNAADVVFLAERETAIRASLLDEAITIDKYGSAATVVNGEIAKIGRHALIHADCFGKTESDGKASTTAGNNTLGRVLGFNRNGFVIAIRRALKVEMERIPATDQSRIVYSMRWGFGRFTPDGTAASINACAGLYNITV